MSFYCLYHLFSKFIQSKIYFLNHCLLWTAVTLLISLGWGLLGIRIHFWFSSISIYASSLVLWRWNFFSFSIMNQLDWLKIYASIWNVLNSSLLPKNSYNGQKFITVSKKNQITLEPEKFSQVFHSQMVANFKLLCIFSEFWKLRTFKKVTDVIHFLQIRLFFP